MIHRCVLLFVSTVLAGVAGYYGSVAIVAGLMFSVGYWVAATVYYDERVHK